MPVIGTNYMYQVNVETPKEGRTLLTALALYDIFLTKNGLLGDYANAGGVETRYENGEWEAVEEDD